MSGNKIVKTPIVYYGGKTSILPALHELTPVHTSYCEEFVGGGFFWSKEPVKSETINDRLDIVINFYRTLKRSYKRLKFEINSTLISRTIYNEAGQIIRAHKYGGIEPALFPFSACSNISASQPGCGMATPPNTANHRVFGLKSLSKCILKNY